MTTQPSRGCLNPGKNTRKPPLFALYVFLGAGTLVGLIVMGIQDIVKILMQ